MTFRRSENPELFDVVKFAYNETMLNYDPPEETLGDEVEELSQSQLDIIEELQIAYDLETEKNVIYDVTSLDGIEKLRNLRHFGLLGTRISQIKDKAQGFVKFAKENFTGEAYDEAIKVAEELILNEYNSNQIADLSPLKKCKKLKYVAIADQRNLDKLDVSCWPELKKLQIYNCNNLEEVSGIEKLDIKDNSNFALKIFECAHFNKIPNFAEVLDKIEKSGERSSVELPLMSYCPLANRNKHLRNDKHFLQSDKIKWLDGRLSINTLQAEMMKTRVEEILAVITKDNYSLIKKLAQVHRWICENVIYDSKKLNRESELLELNDEDSKKLVEEISTILRTAFYALWDKKAVCVGISSLFNFFCSELGVMAEGVFCSSKLEDFISAILSLDYTHMLSKIGIDTEEGRGYYYCDATYDLFEEQQNNKLSEAFCLNKEEMSQLTNLGITEINVQNAPSLQTKLLLKGLLSMQKDNFSFKNYVKGKRLDRRKNALLKQHKRLGLVNPYNGIVEKEIEQ